MAFGANKGTWLFGANSIVANNQATLSTGSAVVAKGDLIVVVIGEVVANTSSGATDTLGNTYTAITAGTLVGATVSGRAFYTIVTNPGTNTNINVQATASANNVAIVAASYEGSFSAIDKQPANNNNTDNASPFTCPATGTLAQQLEVIVAWMVDNTANVKTATSPNIKDNQQSQVTVSSVLGHQVVNVTTTVSPAYTGTNPTASIQGTASFRAANLPENTFDLSLPNQGYAYPVQARGFIESLLPLPLAGEVIPPEPTDTIRAPYFSPPRQPPLLIYDIPSNLLVSTLTPAIQNPFSQLNWPLVRSAEYHISLRSWAGVQQPPAPVGAALPVGNISAALPPRGYEFSVNLRSWTTSPRPVEIVVVVDTSVHRAPHFSLPRKPDPLIPGVLVNPLTLRTLVVQVPFSQTDWPLARELQRAGRTWVASYNLNLIGKDALPTGEIRTELARGYEHHVQLRSWAWSYNLNLIGKDIIPGEIVTARPAIAPSLLQTWIASVNLALTVAPPGVPFSQDYWPLTPAPLRAADLSTWISQTKLLLAAPFNQTDWPVPRFFTPQARTFTGSYNLNLIGKDQLPVGKDIIDLPPQPPLSAIQLRTWINTAALALVTTPAKLPFNQYDWPINIGPRQPTAIFTAAYNKNLIAQDQLPNGEIVSDLPPRGPQQPALSYTASYNQNLIGKDAFPTGAEITALPPQPALSAIQLRTWIQTVNLQLVTVIPPSPFNQTDWPIRLPPTPQARTFTGSYNLNLIGKDALPVGEIRTDVPAQQRLAAFTWINAVNLALTAVQALPAGEINTTLPPQQPLAAQTWISAVNLALTTTVQVLPFNQEDWPINAGPRQPDRSYGYVFPKVLISQDKLPFRQQDWPLYRPFLQPALSYTAFYNRNLIGKDRLPIRQQYWPLTRDIREFRSWINKTDPNLFIPGPAPPPPRSPSHRDVSLAIEATRFGEGEQIRPDAPQSQRPAAPRSTRSNIQDPGIRR